MKRISLVCVYVGFSACCYAKENFKNPVLLPSQRISPTFTESENKQVTFTDHVATDPNQQKPLLLREVLAAVETAYPSILEAQAQIEAREFDRFSSLGSFDPRLKGKYKNTQFGDYENQLADVTLEQRVSPFGMSLFGGYQNGAGDFAVYDGKLNSNEYGAIFGGVKIPTLKDRSTDSARTQIKARQILIDSGKAQLQSAINQVSWFSKRKYWDWIGSGFKLQIMNNLLELAETRDRYLKVRYEKGDIPKLVWIDNQRIILQRRNQLNLAKRSHQKNAIDLSIYLRDSSGKPLLPVDDRRPSYVEPPKKSKEVMAGLSWSIDNHPELQELKKSVQENLAEQELANNELLPKLDLELGSKRELGEGVFKNKTELNVGASLEVPLFFRQARGKLGSLKAKERALNQKQRLLQDTLRNQAQDFLLAMDIHQETYLDAQMEAMTALQVEEGERIKFSSGESDLLLVNIREQSSVDAIFREIDALVLYYQSKAGLEAVLVSPTK